MTMNELCIAGLLLLAALWAYLVVWLVAVVVLPRQKTIADVAQELIEGLEDGSVRFPFQEGER